jgi:hypothetical protein
LDEAGAARFCEVDVLVMGRGTSLVFMTYRRVQGRWDWSCQNAAQEKRGGKESELHDEKECGCNAVLNEE